MARELQLASPGEEPQGNGKHGPRAIRLSLRAIPTGIYFEFNMKPIIATITTVLVFSAGLAFHRYVLSDRQGTVAGVGHYSDAAAWITTYNNHGIRISGSANTSRENNQEAELLQGGMLLTPKPAAELVLSFSEQRDDSEHPEIVDLFRAALSNSSKTQAREGEDVWIVGRIPGNAYGNPGVWHAQAIGIGQFDHSDFFTSGTVFIDLRGPREGVALRAGNYFLIRLAGLKAGSHKLEIWPYYRWEGQDAKPYVLPTQRGMTLNFTVEN